MNPLIRLVIFCVAFSGSLLGCAKENSPALQNDQVILGWVEFVTLQPAGIVAKAKLDTGAKTSSLHAEKIEYFMKDGKQWARFQFKKKRRPPLHGMPGLPKVNQVIEAPVKRMVKIKQHTVDFVDRPSIEMDMELGGKVYKVEFTLTDRDDFIYPVLLGRRFLETSVIVDPAQIHMSGAPENIISKK